MACVSVFVFGLTSLVKRKELKYPARMWPGLATHLPQIDFSFRGAFLKDLIFFCKLIKALWIYLSVFFFESFLWSF